MVLTIFFCYLITLVKLSCNDPQQMEMVAVALNLVFSLVPFLLTLMSYVGIIATILRIPSTAGRQKTFSTCSSHLIVVSIYYANLLTVYMFSTTDILSNLKKDLSVIYTILTPLVNLLFYSLRNKEAQETLRKACRIFMFGPC